MSNDLALEAERKERRGRIPLPPASRQSPAPVRMELLIILLLFVGFALAALRWGTDSRDGPDSPEWERRQSWYGFHQLEDKT